MARNPSPSSDKAHPDSAASARHGGDSHERSSAADPTAGHAPDWFNGSLAVPKKAVDSLLEMQCQCLKSACEGGEILVRDLKELQQARDLTELASAQFTLANQQVEAMTRQAASVMQQIYDTQLLWLGQWDEKSEGYPGASFGKSSGAYSGAYSGAQQGQSALSALGQMQDEWLKVTRGWIDSMNAASHSR